MFVAALLPMTVAGCSRPTGTVSGQVTFQKQPVPAGIVTILHANGTMMRGSIQEGSYSIAKVPAGPCTVLVASFPLSRSMGGGAPSDKPGKALPIPPRYSDPKQSDLHHEVTVGSQTYDIDLKP